MNILNRLNRYRSIPRSHSYGISLFTKSKVVLLNHNNNEEILLDRIQDQSIEIPFLLLFSGHQYHYLHLLEH